MVARAEVLQGAVSLLRGLAPYEQCRHIVQMEYEGHLTHDEGLQLLYLLVDDEMAPVRSFIGKRISPHHAERDAGYTAQTKNTGSAGGDIEG